MSGGPPSGWWLASDGSWYPPQAVPGVAAVVPVPGYPYPAPIAPTGTGQLSTSPYRYCRGCGDRVERAAVICPRCGTTAAPSLPAVVVAPKDKTTAVLLAVFLGIWSWLYTYDRDAAKFWIGIGVGIAGAVLVLLFVGILILIGLHIWAIADVASKPDEYYRHYPNG